MHLVTNSDNGRRQYYGYSYRDWLILFLILLPFLLLTGMMMNRLSAQVLISKIERQGINYDAFREMRFADETWDLAQERINKLYARHPVLEQAQEVSPISYLAFSMLVQSFDLRDRELVDEGLFIKGLPKLTQSLGYRRLCGYYKAILNDIEYFPVPRLEGDKEDITYVDTWSEPRNYGGKRRHEGCDIMAKNNIRGFYPIISITEGVIEKIGWLEKGGYRIGIRSSSGGYFYYAHLASYAEGLKEGDMVLAGQLLGFMGDSGYGEEGTIGQFDVHLHLGIYVETEAGELSVNPYHVLRLLEKNRLTYHRW